MQIICLNSAYGVQRSSIIVKNNTQTNNDRIQFKLRSQMQFDQRHYRLDRSSLEMHIIPRWF